MDDDDKIRRNLVVVSAGIVLTAWLELPVGKAISDVLKVPGWEADKLRLWAAVLAVLVYLAYRFQFSEAGKTAFWKCEEERRRRIEGRIPMILATELPRAFGTSEIPSFFGPTSKGAVELPALYKLMEGREIATGMRSLNPNGMSGVVTVHFQDRSTMQSVSHEFPFVMPKKDVWRLRVSAFAAAWLYSSPAVVFFAPVVLALAGTAVASYRFWRAVLEPIGW